MTDHAAFMRQALAEAAMSDTDVPVGAVVVKDGAVIARAHNRRDRDQDPTAHAEVLALQAAAQALGSRRLSGCTLYVTLEPCPMCAGAVVMSGLNLVVYAASDPHYGCCGSLYHLPMDPRFTHRVPVIAGVLKDEAEAQLRAFFDACRKSSGRKDTQ